MGNTASIQYFDLMYEKVFILDIDHKPGLI